MPAATSLASRSSKLCCFCCTKAFASAGMLAMASCPPAPTMSFTISSAFFSSALMPMTAANTPGSMLNALRVMDAIAGKMDIDMINFAAQA